MPLKFFIALLVMIPAWNCYSFQCKELFPLRTPDYKAFPLEEIYAGQTTVGYEYAFYKALRDAGLRTDLKLDRLSKKNKKKVIESILRELNLTIPVVIDPNGRVFALDQHHDLFALHFISGNSTKYKVPLRVIHDFSLDGVTVDEFKKTLVEEGWVYSPFVDEIVDRPLHVSSLLNSIERSIVGMAFIKTSVNHKIRFKGKYFVPFIQFLLADFIKEKGLLVFSSQFSKKGIDRVTELILKNKEVREFLRVHLVEGTPSGVKRFLQD